MKKVIDFLTANKSGYLATATDNTPHLRPWQFMFAEDGKFWFCTGNIKAVYAQLQENPKIEFSSTSTAMQTLRLSGTITFCNKRSAKERILNENSLVKSIFKTADNPVFETFYLEHGQAILSDFSGNPPQVIDF